MEPKNVVDNNTGASNKNIIIRIIVGRVYV